MQNCIKFSNNKVKSLAIFSINVKAEDFEIMQIIVNYLITVNLGNQTNQDVLTQYCA